MRYTVQVARQRQKQAEEIHQIHSRVKAAVDGKDDIIASLRAQMRSTELVLAQQHAELESSKA